MIPPVDSQLAPKQPDALEAFVHQNRAAFDQGRAPRSMWAAINEELGPEASQQAPQAIVRTIGQAEAFAKTAQSTDNASSAPSAKLLELYPIWRKVAVACMLLTIGILSGVLLSDRIGGGTIADLATGSSNASDIERGYRQELESRVAQVEAFEPDSALRAELVSIAQTDFRTDTELNEAAPSNELVVLQAMAQEYQAKLEVLEHILTRLRDAEEARKSQGAASPSPEDTGSQRL